MKGNSRNLLYLLSLSPGILVVYGNLAGGWFTASNVFYSLFVLAGLECLGKDFLSNNHTPKNDWIPQGILLLHIPLQLLCISSLFYAIYNQQITGAFLVMAALSTGLNSGTSAIVISHEFIHRKSTLYQLFGKLLLFSAGNVYFFIDHLKVHHKWVATDKDHVTAKFGENLYRFFFRSVSQQFKAATHIEAERLKKVNKSAWHLGNYVLNQLLFQLVFLITIYLMISWWGVLAWLIQCLLANFLLEYVNYIEHYGLKRDLKTRVNEAHSWQSDKFVSRFVLVDLSRHADHHFAASKPYHTLQTYKNSPKLPTGYAGLFFMAAIPPLWFSVMHRRMKKLMLI